MIRSLFYKNSQTILNPPATHFAELLQEPQGVLWVDFEGTPPEKDEPILREVFHFHPLAIDDALQESHVPRVDDWGKYLYIVLHSVEFDRQEDDYLHTRELDVFLGENYLVTHHDLPIEALNRVWESIQRDERHVTGGADHILYRLADEVVASYMPVVEGIDDAIDLSEDEIFSRPDPKTLERIFRLKRATIQLRRIIAPQREVLNKLARDDYPVIDDPDRVYFRDVYDHLVRLYDIIDSLRDLISGTLDTYLSVVNNRMNDIMKTLTVITTLFMPLSFVAGFFGMNFFVPEEPLVDWVTPEAFWATMGLMVAIPVVMFMWMRRRGWM